MPIIASNQHGLPKQINGPMENGVAVTPDDSNQLPCVTRGVYVGASGTLTVDLDRTGTNITLTGLAAGIVHPLAVRKIYATGTTATGIVALY